MPSSKTGFEIKCGVGLQKDRRPSAMRFTRFQFFWSKKSISSSAAVSFPPLENNGVEIERSIPVSSTLSVEARELMCDPL
jgi:hypothetical protein